MPVSISLYNHSPRRLVDQSLDYDNIKVMLLDETATFNAADAELVDVAGAANAKEVHGNGWTEGGEPLAGFSVTTVNTNDVKVDADDISRTATGGPIGAAYRAVAYDDTDPDKAPIFFVDFDKDETGGEQAGETTDFKIVWNENGIITFTYT